MTNNRVSKKIRRLARRQVRELSPLLWAEVKKQFLAMLPKMGFWARVRLAIRIIRARSINPEEQKTVHLPKGGPSAAPPTKAPEGSPPPLRSSPRGEATGEASPPPPVPINKS